MATYLILAVIAGYFFITKEKSLTDDGLIPPPPAQNNSTGVPYNNDISLLPSKNFGSIKIETSIASKNSEFQTVHDYSADNAQIKINDKVSPINQLKKTELQAGLALEALDARSKAIVKDMFEISVQFWTYKKAMDLMTNYLTKNKGILIEKLELIIRKNVIENLYPEYKKAHDKLHKAAKLFYNSQGIYTLHSTPESAYYKKINDTKPKNIESLSKYDNYSLLEAATEAELFVKFNKIKTLECYEPTPYSFIKNKTTNKYKKVRYISPKIDGYAIRTYKEINEKAKEYVQSSKSTFLTNINKFINNIDKEAKKINKKIREIKKEEANKSWWEKIIEAFKKAFKWIANILKTIGLDFINKALKATWNKILNTALEPVLQALSVWLISIAVSIINGIGTLTGTEVLAAPISALIAVELYKICDKMIQKIIGKIKDTLILDNSIDYINNGITDDFFKGDYAYDNYDISFTIPQYATVA